MMHTLVIVGCGKLKANKACQAQNMYKGQLFKAAKSHAMKIGTRWLIASAKYGLLMPTDVIKPYDKTLTGAGRDEKAAFRHSCQADYAGYLTDFGKPDRVVILAGKLYVDPLVGEHGTALRNVDQIELPLEGMGIGERLAYFKRHRELDASG